MQGLDAKDLASVVKEIDVGNADCLCDGDRDMILANIREHHGSMEAFDAALKLQLTLKPLSYKVDLDQLRMRSKGTHWKWEAVQGWLENKKSRALCVMAGAGEKFEELPHLLRWSECHG